MNWFKKKQAEDVIHAIEAIDNAVQSIRLIEDENIEEWIWINGYKGTDKDMKCRDYQFEMDKQFDISDEKPVELCSHGFHLCRELDNVFNYYGIGDNNRFFEVRALVRKSDLDNLGSRFIQDKLAAKSIVFTRELTVDEILRGRIPNDWTDEEKKLALEIGLHEAREKITFEKLVALGYSKTFAQLCINAKRDKVALSVGTQDGLSMDMKAYLIFNINKK